MPAAGLYHCSVKPVGRAAGRSIVAAAAYRAGERMTDALTRQAHDYRARAGVVTAFLVLPPDAPLLDRAALWNAAEAAETRRNGRLATELELALPHELSAAQRRALAEGFARTLAERHGVAVDVAIHAPGRGGDHRNHHAHLLVSHRRFGAAGFGELAKAFDGAAKVRAVRQEWEQVANRAYSLAGLDIRIDHRSHADRGIPQEPTQHLGPKASGIERRGEKSERGDANRAIVADNAALSALVSEREQVTAEIISLAAARDAQAQAQQEAQRAMDQAEAARLAAAQAAEQRRQDAARQAERQAAAQQADAERQTQMRQAAQLAQDEQQKRQEVERVATLTREAQAAELARLEAVKLDQLREQQARAAAYVQEQERQAEQAKRERAERETAERAQAGRTPDGAIRNAGDRYAQALGEHYDMRSPYSSLARAAMAEAGAFNRDQEALRQQAAAEQDPARRELLTLRREIESAEHLAQSGKRVARINETLTGRRDDQWQQFAAERSAEAVTLREQYRERAAAQERAEAQQRQQAEPARAISSRERRKELIRQGLEHERQRRQAHERER